MLACTAVRLRRKGSSTPIYEFTCGLAAMEAPSAEMQALFGAIRGNQSETNRFLGLVEGTTSIPEYFAPENIGRIITGNHAIAMH